MRRASPESWYDLFLALHPRAFRERHGGEMKATFGVLLAGAEGRWQRGWVWVVGGVDALGSALRQWWRLLAHRRVERQNARDRGNGARGRQRREFMSTLWQDLRYTLRMLRRQPVLATAAVITLALGIGATTTIFSIVSTAILRPLPYRDAGRLVTVWSANPGRGWHHTDVSLPDAWDWRTQAKAFQDLAVFGRSSANLTGSGEPERLTVRLVTPNLFSVLGVKPGLGRDFREGDNAVGAPEVAILSDGFWRRRFGGDPAVVGSTIHLNGGAVTVIGVMPAGFSFLDQQPDLWIPYRIDPLTAHRTAHANVAVARLLPGVTVAQAEVAVAQVARDQARIHPETNEGWTTEVHPLQADLLSDNGVRAMQVLMVSVCLVLLMACVNVANLLLARANARRQEMAMRVALGAGRGRLLRQLMTESLVLGLASGSVGMVLAVWGERTIVAALPANLSPAFHFAIDGVVLVFALLVSLAAALVFGLAPALRGAGATGADLRADGRSGGSRRRRRFGNALVVAQAALAVTLLAAGGVMLRSVVHMQREDLGFEAGSVLTARLTLPGAKYTTEEQADVFYQQVLERIRALPGVEAAGTVYNLPLSGSNSVGSFAIAGVPVTPDRDGYPARYDYVSPDYFRTMRIGLVEGRDFSANDRAGSPPVIIVNEALVRRYFGGVEPLGQRIITDSDMPPREVVGVVRDVHERSLERAPEPALYVPVAQVGSRTRTLAVRTAGPQAALIKPVRQAVWAVDADQPLYDIRPMDDLIALRLSPFRLIAGLLGSFAAISLLLGAVGIYGVTAYGVGRRTQEIGLRLALGAERRTVVAMVLRESMTRALVGVVLGTLLGLALTRGLGSLLVGVSPADPLTFGSVIAGLLLVTFLGAYLPARRASAVDPVRALARE